MNIIYKTENERYLNLINKYRQESKVIKDKEHSEQLQRKHNKQLKSETQHEVMFSTIDNGNLEWNQEPAELQNKSYSFVNFVNTKMGKHAILSEDEMYKSNASFWNVTFMNCIFQNIKFINCKFFGCKFINCKTDEFGVVFEDCFFDEISTGFNENKEFQIYNVSTEFVNCMITSAKFIRCNLDKSIWEECTLMLTSYNNCTLIDGIF